VSQIFLLSELTFYLCSGLRERNLAFDCYKNPNLFTELQYYDVDALIEAGKKVLAEEQRVISLILDTSFTVSLLLFTKYSYVIDATKFLHRLNWAGKTMNSASVWRSRLHALICAAKWYESTRISLFSNKPDKYY
jgi:hypothetical protein